VKRDGVANPRVDLWDGTTCQSGHHLAELYFLLPLKDAQLVSGLHIPSCRLEVHRIEQVMPARGMEASSVDAESVEAGGGGSIADLIVDDKEHKLA
jgi:hypothetical protein